MSQCLNSVKQAYADPHIFDLDLDKCLISISPVSSVSLVLFEP